MGGGKAPAPVRRPRQVGRTRRRARRRVLLSALLGGALLALVAAGAGDGRPVGASRIDGANSLESGTPVLQVVIAPGDTIWTVAGPHVPEGENLQTYVAEVIAINQIDPSALQPGSVLDLPLDEPHEAHKR